MAGANRRPLQFHPLLFTPVLLLLHNPPSLLSILHSVILAQYKLHPSLPFLTRFLIPYPFSLHVLPTTTHSRGTYALLPCPSIIYSLPIFFLYSPHLPLSFFLLPLTLSPLHPTPSRVHKCTSTQPYPKPIDPS